MDKITYSCNFQHAQFTAKSSRNKTIFDAALPSERENYDTENICDSILSDSQEMQHLALSHHGQSAPSQQTRFLSRPGVSNKIHHDSRTFSQSFSVPVRMEPVSISNSAVDQNIQVGTPQIGTGVAPISKVDPIATQVEGQEVRTVVPPSNFVSHSHAHSLRQKAQNDVFMIIQDTNVEKSCRAHYST